MKTTKVSVIIPTYNSCNLLLIAIESVLAQTWKNLELIIVNDSSTDMTGIAVKKFIDLIKR